MSTLNELVNVTLEDRAIDDVELAAIRETITTHDGQLNGDAVRKLVELYCDARECPPAFEEFFFSVLREAFLADGQISSSEQFYLLKILYSDRTVRPRERAFLAQLRRETSIVSPEFAAICDEALAAHETKFEA